MDAHLALCFAQSRTTLRVGRSRTPHTCWRGWTFPYLNEPAQPPAHAGKPRARSGNRRPAHTTLERRRPLRLYHQVQMVSLNAELKDSESLCARGAQGDLDRRKQALASQARQPGCRTQRHVGGTVPIVRDAAAVRHAAAPGRGSSSGAGPATAPDSQGELELFRGLYLNWQIAIISAHDDQDIATARLRGVADQASPTCETRPVALT